MPSQVSKPGLLVTVGPVGVMAEPLQAVTAGGVGWVAKAGQATVAAPLAGTTGLVRVPGMVVTELDSALTVLASLLQAQRVRMVCAGPAWL